MAEQAGERLVIHAVTPGVGGTGPPHHEVGGGTGERHVDDAVGFLHEFQPPPVGHGLAAPGHRSRQGEVAEVGGLGGVAAMQDPRRPHPALHPTAPVGHRGVGEFVLLLRRPQVGAQHDGELEALGPVDREHLHRLVVAIDAAGHLVDGRLGAATVGQGVEHLGHLERAGRMGADGGLEQLGDVLEVGDAPLAAAAPKEPVVEAMAPRLGEYRHRATAHQDPGPPGNQLVVHSGIGVGSDEVVG